VKDKPVAIGRKYEWNIEGYGIIQGLLHAVTDAVVVVLGLDHGDRDIGLVIKDVIGALRLPARDQFSADADAPFGKSDFLADCIIPSQPARLTAGPINLEQMSRSLRSFLLTELSVVSPSRNGIFATTFFTAEASFRPNIRGIPLMSPGQIGVIVSVRLRQL